MRLLLPAGVAPLQKELVAVTTKWWQEKRLTGRVRLRFVPRLLPATVPQRFLYMEKKARLQRTEWLWARLKITLVTMEPTQAVRCPVLTKLSWTYSYLLLLSKVASATFFITGRLNHCSGETQKNNLSPWKMKWFFALPFRGLVPLRSRWPQKIAIRALGWG